MLRKWKEYGDRIAETASQVLGECEVFAFGSVVKGRATGGSDVDILVVSRNLPQGDRSHLKALIEERAGLPPFHPFEIHLVTPQKAEVVQEARRGVRQALAGRVVGRRKALTSPFKGWR
jgi:Predicted nucleotidyltransferases